MTMGIATPKPAEPEPVPAASGSPERGLAIGTVVSDRYRVVRLLGEGAMGAVYEVEHLHMRKPFALKVLHGSVSSNPEVVARFEREAIVAGNIGHPNVAAATDFGTLADGSFFLILEFVAGKSLRDLLEAGRLEPARARRIMRGILAGVGAAHAMGIVHRDLKPENVMLASRDGNPDYVKVLDFGIAGLAMPPEMSRDSGVQALTRAGVVMGTPDYMPPEQAVGGAVDARSDLYSLGVMLFEMLTGSRPFQGGVITMLRSHVLDDAPQLPPELVATINPQLAGVVQKLMAKQPEQRFQSAAEVSAALDQVTTTGTPVPAEVPFTEAPTVPPPPPQESTPAHGGADRRRRRIRGRRGGRDLGPGGPRLRGVWRGIDPERDRERDRDHDRERERDRERDRERERERERERDTRTRTRTRPRPRPRPQPRAPPRPFARMRAVPGRRAGRGRRRVDPRMRPAPGEGRGRAASTSRRRRTGSASPRRDREERSAPRVDPFRGRLT